MTTATAGVWIVKEMGKQVALPEGDKEILAIVLNTHRSSDLLYVPLTIKNGKLVNHEYEHDEILAYTEFSPLRLSSRPICIFWDEGVQEVGRFPLGKNITHAYAANGDRLTVEHVDGRKDFPMIKIVYVTNERAAKEYQEKKNKKDMEVAKRKRLISQLAFEYAPLLLDAVTIFAETWHKRRVEIHSLHLSEFDLVLERAVKPERIERNAKNFIGTRGIKNANHLIEVYLHPIISQLERLLKGSRNKFALAAWINEIENNGIDTLHSLSDVALKHGIPLTKAKRIVEQEGLEFFVCPVESHKGQMFIKSSLFPHFKN